MQLSIGGAGFVKRAEAFHELLESLISSIRRCRSANPETSSIIMTMCGSGHTSYVERYGESLFACLAPNMVFTVP